MDAGPNKELVGRMISDQCICRNSAAPHAVSEAGIECLDLSLRGTISWPGFGRRGEDWFGFLFVVTRLGGAPFERNPEGALEWVGIDEVEKLPLWEGDRHFLPLVFDADPRLFHGVMPYRDGRMLSWTYSRT